MCENYCSLEQVHTHTLFTYVDAHAQVFSSAIKLHVETCFIIIYIIDTNKQCIGFIFPLTIEMEPDYCECSLELTCLKYLEGTRRDRL